MMSGALDPILNPDEIYYVVLNSR